MKNKSIYRTTIPITVINVVIITLIIGYNYKVDNANGPSLFVGIILLSFLVNFYVVRFSIKKFINPRLKKIYSLINTDDAIQPIIADNNKSDSLDETEKEVMIWASKKKQEKTELKKMEIYRKEFLGNVSHELKTPIFNALGFVETLLDGGIEDDKINRKYLEKAEKNIQRLIAIIEDLDKISRFETDQIQLEKEVFDMHEVMEEVIEALEHSANKHKISISIDGHSSVPFLVIADRDKIYQVLSNLLINSIKYGIENGWSRLSYKKVDGHAEIIISDNGIGISSNHLPRLFERFYRVDTNRSRELGGTGLGLAIVKHIIEAHHQRIQVESTLSIGTTVTFSLELSELQ